MQSLETPCTISDKRVCGKNTMGSGDTHRLKARCHYKDGFMGFMIELNRQFCLKRKYMESKWGQRSSCLDEGFSPLHRSLTWKLGMCFRAGRILCQPVIGYGLPGHSHNNPQRELRAGSCPLANGRINPPFLEGAQGSGRHSSAQHNVSSTRSFCRL